MPSLAGLKEFSLNPITLPSSVSVGCTRVSTVAQRERYGPQRQREDMALEAQRIGKPLIAVLDEQQSGTQWDRAAIGSYFTLAEQHPGLNFIFPSPDRIGRETELGSSIVRGLKERGATVWVIGVAHPIGNKLPFSKDSEIRVKELLLEAEKDHHRIVKNLARGKRDNALAGQWPHGRPPYGYKLDGRRKSLPVLCGPGAEAVTRMFDLLLETPIGRTCDALMLEGHPNPTGGTHWNSATVRQLAHNRMYAGEYIFARRSLEPVIVPVPALIPLERWEAVQRAICGRRGVARRENPRGLLTHHLECAVCGAGLGLRMGGTPARNNVLMYYACSLSGSYEARRRNLEQCENGTFHRMERLEGQVWEFLLEHLPDPIKLGQILGQDEKPIDHSSEKERLKETLKRAEKAYIRGLLTEMEVDEETRGSRERLRELEALERSGPVRIDAVQAARRIEESLRGRVTLEDKREFLRTFGVRVQVGAEGIVEVRVRV